jgi:hypothetical protein
VSTWLSNLSTLKHEIASRLVIFLILAAFFVAPKFVSAKIVVNEIMYDLSGADDKHEWVELYNSGSSPVDLTDYKFNDGANHILNLPPEKGSRGSMVLGANEYLLLADDALTVASDLPNYSGTIIDTVLDLPNTNAVLKLLNQDGSEVSAAAYNKDLGAAGNGRSLEWDGTALEESTVDGGTPGRVNSVLSSSGAIPSATPLASPNSNTTETVAPSPSTTTQAFDYSQDILINEFLPAPNDGEKEWVELLNTGSSVISLTGWQVDDADNSTSPQVIPDNTTIAPNSFLVISFNKSTLNNDGDKVRLLWPNDQVIHAVSYNKAKQGQSVAKFDSGWLWTNQPTPGSANKKAVIEKNESIATAATVVKINPIEESVVAPTTPTTSKKVSTPQTTINPETAFSAAAQPANNPENINLSAAASKSTKESSKINSILSLAGVILLAGLAAGGLIYFRHQKQIDIDGADD